MKESPWATHTHAQSLLIELEMGFAGVKTDNGKRHAGVNIHISFKRVHRNELKDPTLDFIA